MPSTRGAAGPGLAGGRDKWRTGEGALQTAAGGHALGDCLNDGAAAAGGVGVASGVGNVMNGGHAVTASAIPQRAAFAWPHRHSLQPFSPRHRQTVPPHITSP